MLFPRELWLHYARRTDNNFLTASGFPVDELYILIILYKMYNIGISK